MAEAHQHERLLAGRPEDPQQVGGAVRLSWRPAAEVVDGYELVLLSDQLVTIVRFEVGRDTTITLPAAALAEPFRSGEVLLYRVDALVGGDVVAQSETGSLQK